MAEKLAIYGGPKAKTTPNYPMYPGGLEIGEAEKKEVMEVLDNKYLFRYYGPEGVESKVRKFEEHFKAKMGAKHCLATSSCTGALLSALTACGIGPGDECIVTGYTFFASCAAIVGAKAIPVIAEVDETLTIDPADIEKKINHYDYNPEKAVELLKQAGFVYNADGSDYVDGSGEVRYAKVTEEQAKYYESFNKVLADGTILMPATVNWASSEGNAVSALLSTMLANSVR